MCTKERKRMYIVKKKERAAEVVCTKERKRMYEGR